MTLMKSLTSEVDLEKRKTLNSRRHTVNHIYRNTLLEDYNPMETGTTVNRTIGLTSHRLKSSYSPYTIMNCLQSIT